MVLSGGILGRFVVGTGGNGGCCVVPGSAIQDFFPTRCVSLNDSLDLPFPDSRSLGTLSIPLARGSLDVAPILSGSPTGPRNGVGKDWLDLPLPNGGPPGTGSAWSPWYCRSAVDPLGLGPGQC